MDIMKKHFIRSKIFFPEVCMRGKMIVCVCALSLFLNAATVFCASDSTDRARDSLHQKWWAQLNLTADQQAKLKALRSGTKDFRKANIEKMKSLLDKTKEELLKPAPSKAVLYGFAKEIGDLHKARSEHMADHMLTLKTILTKEQFQKFLSRDFHKGMGPGEKGHRPHGDMDD
jgi:Spy/CpxP family protein refolding chaperone